MSVKDLWVMAGIHFVSMYVLMFAMISSSEYFVNNLNFVYMAALMTAPMLIMEPVMMGQMYKNKTKLKYVAWSGMLVLLGAFLLIRDQTLIGNKEFIRSMIPHHSGAILMCREAVIEDQELAQLCVEIIETQQEEIDQMQNILTRLEN